jgi:hypothetical protein
MNIQKIENFLSEELFTELINYIKKLNSNKNTIFKSNLNRWQTELLDNSTPVIIYSFEENDKDIFFKLKKEIEKQIPFVVYGIYIYQWPKLSYLPWHTDEGYKSALTLYLNESWNPNWGGYFMYEMDNEIKAIKPEKNLAVLQEGGVPHCVNTININAPIRCTMQIFLTKSKSLL